MSSVLQSHLCGVRGRYGDYVPCLAEVELREDLEIARVEHVLLLAPPIQGNAIFKFVQVGTGLLQLSRNSVLYTSKHFFEIAVWGLWANWGQCSVPCGGGSQSRTRPCASGNCPPSAATESRPCNISPCARKFYCRSIACVRTMCIAYTRKCCLLAQYGLWVDWSVCTVTCGGGTHYRTRQCWTGNCPPGSLSQTTQCSVLPCPGTCIYYLLS